MSGHYPLSGPSHRTETPRRDRIVWSSARHWKCRWGFTPPRGFKSLSLRQPGQAGLVDPRRGRIVWPSARHSKCRRGLTPPRGFESHPLRWCDGDGRPGGAATREWTTPGGVSEWSKETVLKTVGPHGSRGFESHPLRWNYWCDRGVVCGDGVFPQWGPPGRSPAGHGSVYRCFRTGNDCWCHTDNRSRDDTSLTGSSHDCSTRTASMC